MKSIKKLLKQALVQSERERDSFAKSLGITGGQMSVSVIDFISDQQDKTTSQHSIELEFNLRRSTVTVMIQRMEKRDLVKRITSANDKRQKLVSLTDKGKALVPKIKAKIKMDNADLQQRFSPEQLSATIEVLEYIKNGKDNE
ncbi:MarR family winged helix-turn-helix transcriptional regulator [Lactobacillus kalixensis]|uniref:Transcriptional regulator n=1 Tax=Lactobacillus kalixensis DSM 16043 TaxID=1423763 RepID=A0A0R1UGN2_9LACO|nr:MarR family transcriptional regulator [Lactobacillus kalixensis]KRL89941.1 transcriptional regulator [Lactobacillus kalixensis DSM 16043]